MGFDDARVVLKSFEGTYIPVEFARREKILREKFEAQQTAKGRPKRSIKLGSLFKQQSPDGMPTLDEAEAQGKMYWDLVRERGQKQYMELEKRITEEGAKWLAEKDAEEKRMQEEAMQNMKKGWIGWGSKKS
jgi:import inner membrane translocase subunit TIM50